MRQGATGGGDDVEEEEEEEPREGDEVIWEGEEGNYLYGSILGKTSRWVLEAGSKEGCVSMVGGGERALARLGEASQVGMGGVVVLDRGGEIAEEERLGGHCIGGEGR